MAIDLKTLEKVLIAFAPSAFHGPIHDDFLQLKDNEGVSVFQSIDSMKDIWNNKEVCDPAKATFARGIIVGIIFSSAIENPVFQEICKSMLEKFVRAKGENVADFMLARIKKGT